VLEAITGRGLIQRSAEQGGRLAQLLHARFGQHPHVGDIRGRGLFMALELVEDRETKATFDPARQVHARVKQTALDNGLICYPMGGTSDGRHGDHVLIAPPYIIADDEMDELVDKLGRSIDAVVSG